MKILLDTNVILDVLLDREPRKDMAKKIFSLIYQEKIEAYTTASSVTDIYYIIAKRLGDKAAREAIRNLLNMLGVIAVDGEDCAEALELPVADFEDALISVCANKESIDLIVSNDEEFNQEEKTLVGVVTPDEFWAGFER